MVPKWHILFGAAFTFLVWLFVPQIPLILLVLVFLSSFLIDFDHYAFSVYKNRTWSLKRSFEYHREECERENQDIKAGIRRKGDFHLFRTVEFHALVGLISIVLAPLFYIFIGMLFHSMLDVIDLIRQGKFHRREYFFFNWLRKKI